MNHWTVFEKKEDIKAYIEFIYSFISFCSGKVRNWTLIEQLPTWYNSNTDCDMESIMAGIIYPITGGERTADDNLYSILKHYKTAKNKSLKLKICPVFLKNNAMNNNVVIRSILKDCIYLLYSSLDAELAEHYIKLLDIATCSTLTDSTNSVPKLKRMIKKIIDTGVELGKFYDGENAECILINPINFSSDADEYELQLKYLSAMLFLAYLDENYDIEEREYIERIMMRQISCNICSLYSLKKDVHQRISWLLEKHKMHIVSCDSIEKFFEAIYEDTFAPFKQKVKVEAKVKSDEKDKKELVLIRPEERGEHSSKKQYGFNDKDQTYIEILRDISPVDSVTANAYLSDSNPIGKNKDKKQSDIQECADKDKEKLCRKNKEELIVNGSEDECTPGVRSGLKSERAKSTLNLELLSDNVAPAIPAKNPDQSTPKEKLYPVKLLRRLILNCMILAYQDDDFSDKERIFIKKLCEKGEWDEKICEDIVKKIHELLDAEQELNFYVNFGYESK